MADFKFTVNVAEVSAKLGQAIDLIKTDLRQAIKTLSASTHAFVVAQGQQKLKGYALEQWTSKKKGSSTLDNVRWTALGDDMYVVEIDPKLRWIEEGRPATSMATEQWLLKGPVTERGKPGVHRAKDGSLYRSIPMPQAQGAGKSKNIDQTPALAALVKQALKDYNINLKRIERNPDGSPKTGVLHKMDMRDYEPSRSIAGFHSKPRTPAEAAATGLKAHEGHFFLEGMAVVQRPNPASKHGVTREAITFRTVSTKSQAENRWIYPEVPALNSIPAAYEYAKEQWEKILKELESKFNSNT